MKKIGILTLQYALNYGGVLQCFALKEVLRLHGYDVVIIDRIPDGFGIKYVIKRALVHPFTQSVFTGMRQTELKPMSATVYSSDGLSKILREYYACIVGSDQVWRKAVFSVNGDYFFQHVNIPSVRKIAYAASFGVSEWEYNQEETKVIRESLSRFYAVSVRESDGIKLLYDNCGISAKCVLDPTLLAPVEIYNSLLKKSHKDGHGLIVTYILDWTKDKTHIINDLKRRMGKPSIDILSKESRERKLINRFFSGGVTVYDWLKLISSADFIVTDSFHGTVFSIIFNRPFVTIGNTERGMARFTSLLGLLGLSDRLVTSSKNFEINIDYREPNIKLLQEKKKSLDFLLDSLR